MISPDASRKEIRRGCLPTTTVTRDVAMVSVESPSRSVTSGAGHSGFTTAHERSGACDGAGRKRTRIMSSAMAVRVSVELPAKRVTCLLPSVRTESTDPAACHWAFAVMVAAATRQRRGRRGMENPET